MKICKNCGEECEDTLDMCPVCHGSLFKTLQNMDAAAISMGDANAVSGGIHHTTDNSVKHDNSVSSSNNVSNSNNTTTNNIYQGPVTKIEPEKSKEELLKERKLEYRECCKRVLVDGILTWEKRRWLDEQRIRMDLSEETATHILTDVNNMCKKTIQKMGALQRAHLKTMKEAVKNNWLPIIHQLLPDVKVDAANLQEDEIQFLYHMVMAALVPQDCVEAYTQCRVDNYWLSYWTYVAYCKLGDVPNAAKVMGDLNKWNGLMPEDNLLLLEALKYIMGGYCSMAEQYFSESSKEYSPILSDLYNVIKAILADTQNKTDISETISKNRFYVDNFFKEQYEHENNKKKQQLEEERKRKEAEEKRRAEEERRRAEEQERLRRAAEEKARKEAEEKRRAEEQRRWLEEQRRQEERKKHEAEEQARRDREDWLRREEQKHLEYEDKEKNKKLAFLIAMLQEYKSKEEKRYVVTLVSFVNNNRWQTMKAIQGCCECSLKEAQSYIDDLPLEIMCIAREVNFIKKTFEELGATVQIHEYTENERDDEIETCPNCDSTNVTDNGDEYLSFFCNDCGNRYGYRNDLKCPKCGSTNIWDDGTEDEEGQQYFCIDCEHEWGNPKKEKEDDLVCQYGNKNMLRLIFVKGNGTIPDFYISDIPITQGLWNEVMGEKYEIKRSKYGVGENYPMYFVNVEDCEKFIEKFHTLFIKGLLKNQDSDDGLFNELFNMFIFSLPTEEQWYYAAMGGIKKSGAKYYSGSNNINEVAWYVGNSGSRTHEVRTKKPNELGIYDMCGNVMEWCLEGNGKGVFKNYVTRGGSWNNMENECWMQSRNTSFSSECSSPIIGFRIVLQIKK